MKRKIFYEYIVQLKLGDIWYDYYTCNDRKMVESVFKILKSKYQYDTFRVVRSVI